MPWFPGCGCACGKTIEDDVSVSPAAEYKYSKAPADTEEAIATKVPGLDPGTPRSGDVQNGQAKTVNGDDSANTLPQAILGSNSQKSLSEKSGSPPNSPGLVTGPSTRTVDSTASLNTASSTATSVTPSSMFVNPGTSTPTNGSMLPEDVRRFLEETDRNRISGWIFSAERSYIDLFKRLGEEGKTDILEMVKETQQYQALIADLEESNRLLLALLDDEGWTLQKEADKILVWTKPEPGTDLVTVRMAGLCEGSFDVYCAIGKEVHLIKNWMPGVKTSHLIKQLNTFDHIGYYVWKFPLVSAREFLVEETCVINDPEGYCICKRDLPQPRDGVELPELQKGVVRAAISNWSAFSMPVGDKKNFVVTVMNVDLKIPLPTWLVNQLSISMGFKSFKELRQNVKAADNPKSDFSQCVANNAAYYGRMRSLEKIRETKDIPCKQEILKTGWVKDPRDRKRLFNRSSGVLVPIV